MRNVRFSLVALSLFLGSCLGVPRAAQAFTCDAKATDVACIHDGAVKGIADGEMMAFRGIPYAKPPVGALRWRVPEAPAKWSDLRDASRFAAMCPQFVGKEMQGSEDCLYVNVWRPRVTPKKRLPVMIWLTGGGNHSLSGEGTVNFGGVKYEGSQMVPRGVIFVTYNLRLGPLGFLAHASLDAERREHVSGNYGSLDQIAMLKWVHDNIAAFGGDPDHVFLFGTSAGGGNICALMSSPFTKGLIHGAAMESSVPSGCEIQTLKDAEDGTGAKLVKMLGCDTASDTAACLRAKDFRDVVAAMPGNFSVLPRLYGPNMDGLVFPDQPLKRIREGKVPAMPLIIGNSTGETLEWADSAGAVKDQQSYEAAIDRVFGASARAAILSLYPASAYATPRDAFAHVTTDAEFTCQSRRVAQVITARHKAPIYRYLFDWTLQNDPVQKARGAIHTVEHPFFFGWQGTYKPTDADRMIQSQMVGYWTNMARTGKPNGDGLPPWSPVAAGNEAYLLIGKDTAAKTGFGDAHCDFWDKTPLVWPHM